MRRIATFLLVSGLGVAAGLYFARPAMAMLKKERDKTAHSQDQMRKSEADEIQLEKQKVELESASGRDRESREHGYLPQGQRLLDSK